MKPAPFEYHRPETLAEALALLTEHGDWAKPLAGGQSLVPAMSFRLAQPSILVDLNRLDELSSIQPTAEGGVQIGAMTRHSAAERSALIEQRAPLLHEVMPWIAHPQIRNRGTVGGSLAHADPAAELPAVALATGATLIVQSTNGSREVDAADFFQGYLETDIQPDEMLTAVRFPSWPTIAGASVGEISRRHGDYAMVGLACALAVEGGVIRDVALSFFGASSTPVRAVMAEESLVEKPPTEEHFAAAATLVSSELSPSADGHASAAYRRHVAGLLTRRGLAEALSRIEVTR